MMDLGLFSGSKLRTKLDTILDSLAGIDGLILDDFLFNSVEINWQDKDGEDEFEIQIEYPEFHYGNKKDLFF